LINPVGQNQAQIASNDKDWNIILKKLFQISLECTLNYVHENVGTKDAAFNEYDQSLFDRAYKAMHKAEGDEKNPAGFIDAVFGFESFYDKEIWLKEA